MNRHLFILCTLLTVVSISTQADTLFTEDFQDANYNGWTLSGSGAGYISLYASNYSLKLTRSKQATTTLSTVGYTNTSISMEIAAASLEGNETCVGEVSVDNGTSWTTVIEVSNGQDDGYTLHQGSAAPSGLDNNNNVQFRFRSAANQWDDSCWNDNVLVTGNPGTSQSPDISVSNSVTFGSVAIASSADQVVTVNNVGDADLTITAVSALSAPFSTLVDNCANQTVVPAGSCTLTLRFAPTSTGAFASTLSINSNDPDEPSTAIALSGTGTAINDNYDPLTGNGNVNRSALTYNTLINGNDPGSLINLSAYALPNNAAQPTNILQGTLQLSNEATGGSFQEVRDDYNYTGATDTTRKHLPEFNFEFIQTGTHLFPVQRGSIASTHPEWEYLLEPGRVWQENGDNGFSRVAIPFSLQQKNANCIHNGVMSFLFQGNAQVSKVAYQMSSETCLYFKFNLWGLLDATYTAHSINDSQTLKTQYQAEVSNRMPSKPIAELSTDYSADYTQFGHSSETNPDHMTVYGFVIGGVNYVGGCETRHGTYPYCAVMDIPSYSTAKSSFAGVAMMRLEKQYPGVVNQLISSQVPVCAANGNWSDVSIENTLDMATGNYGSTNYLADESAAHTSGLFLVESHANKINYSCTQYARKATPGNTWIYHTSDTYVAGTAMNAYLKSVAGSNSDIFTDTLVNDIWTPLNLSPTAKVSRRTYDADAQPFTGWGLTYLSDDIAKIVQFLNVDDGKINNQRVLDQAEFNSAMQRDPNDRGLAAGGSDYRYNNGFWAHDAKSILGCTNSTWIPFMSGFGGITVLMMPNDTTYYFASDNDTYYWAKAAIESNKINGFCQ
jgi:HYDIN/CFA65/VesB-like, Ig-like domain